ncbi:GNAT family N-acetyltransferase [Chitinophaga arvensicola]|uniref:Protein N-acetyltransferase, RimJ/RimL family n=1 Tax=Chitinophaga arvensicola TaxID=29529 RepID=A0A1I0RSM5_9BACT|nr:GNAT family N-acetyltransferase [Chitinophaga arvensicola]SEW44364.1 Protein N-acetyltransferase, RimJ/RimL family [Chitinophaga arvensicola]
MIQTPNLYIQPLTYPQLVKYIRADYSLEEELQLKPIPRTIAPELKEAMEQSILPQVANANNNYLFHTLWTIISRSEQQMVGDLCFTGAPDDSGAIEIGYGTHEAFRGRGFMTEAVKEMLNWAAAQSGVKSVIATTNKDNPSSQAVLKKNGFVVSGETEEMIYWKFPVA